MLVCAGLASSTGAAATLALLLSRPIALLAAFCWSTSALTLDDLGVGAELPPLLEGGAVVGAGLTSLEGDGLATLSPIARLAADISSSLLCPFDELREEVEPLLPREPVCWTLDPCFGTICGRAGRPVRASAEAGDLGGGVIDSCALERSS